ncbi:DUF262 domain-containing HNH endonuclease family protein [Agrococcus sp. HG114]|uniref:DUF262 domain-containing protein n=1 Tax=Agrococcus sp. HG114 TaxID=2969757 RepID=UPI00215AE202|nr:DUF262 domain-containing HNH endonuclease family protein [Agrococcus sp. HG114]MCR8669585.1 DUF262 domain-containing HNH endonuclease family protein [Agrococcus sp. HG114]
MSIQPHYRTISELLKNRTFAIDEYQREYKWEHRHIEELINDLVNRFQGSYRDGDTPRSVPDYSDYFLGSIIVTQREGRSYLVDGQQRVTSLTLLLIFLYREAKARSLNVASTVADLVYSDSYGEHVFNLDIPERTPVLRALFNGEPYTSSGQDESIGTILARYDDIDANDFEDELGDALETFVYWLINRVGLIEIVASNDAQAYAIFETMNDRGKPLSPVDMLKAYLLAPVHDEAERARSNSVWRRMTLELNTSGDEPDPERDAVMMKAWLRSQHAESVRERKAGSLDRDWETIGTTFHRWIRDSPERLRVGDAARNVEIMTEELPFFAGAYLRIMEASRRYTPGLEHVFYNAHNEFTWQPTVLLAPLERHDDPETVRRKIAATAAFLDIWIMRRVSNYIRVGYSTTSYAMYLLVKEIRRRPLEELVELLTRRLEEDDVTFEGAPSRGRSGIRDLALNQFSKRYIYHLLARITAYVDLRATGADRFAETVDRARHNPFDIEHIWHDDHDYFAASFPSRSDFEAARNRIGGLLLLPADVNRSVQAKPYEEKARQYANQNFFAASLTSQPYSHQPQFRTLIERDGLPFRPMERFGVAEQAERGELVLDLAQRVWSPDGVRRAAGY